MNLMTILVALQIFKYVLDWHKEHILNIQRQKLINNYAINNYV